jgi:hypothetical protein
VSDKSYLFTDKFLTVTDVNVTGNCVLNATTIDVVDSAVGGSIVGGNRLDARFGSVD